MKEQKESPFYVQAIEDSDILEINLEGWNKLISENSCWDKFIIEMLYQTTKRKERREKEFLFMDAQERYLRFLRYYDDNIINRISQRAIASYLGITAESLSRIRKKLDL